MSRFRRLPRKLIPGLFGLLALSPGPITRGAEPSAYLAARYLGSAAVPASADGMGEAARFMGPGSIAHAGGGVMYIVDTKAHAIRRVSASGEVTTFAGSPGQGGRADGAGAAARFAFPQDIAVGVDGTLYVADTGNLLIRRVSTSGVVTTIAGGSWLSTGFPFPALETTLYEPRAVAVNSTGTVLFSEARGIIAISPQGIASVLVDVSKLPQVVTDIAIDANDNLALLTTWDQRVYRVSASGEVEARVLNAPRETDKLRWPVALALAPDGAVYIADSGTRAIHRLSPTGVLTRWREAGEEVGLMGPTGLAISNNGELVVSDGLQAAVLRFSAAGELRPWLGVADAGRTDGAFTRARLLAPSTMTRDRDGRIYVIDAGRVRRIDPVRRDVQTVGILPGDEVGRYGGMALDGSGNLYISDRYDHTILVLPPGGQLQPWIGVRGQRGHRDGRGPEALFSSPIGLAVDPAGGVFIADTGNHVIRRVHPVTGQVSTVAGAVGQYGNADGPPALARFRYVSALAVDAHGALWIGDSARVRRLNQDGDVFTVAGDEASYDALEGHGSKVMLGLVSGLAVDATGAAFVADGSFHTVRRISPQGYVTVVMADDGPRHHGADLDVALGSPWGVVEVQGTVYVSSPERARLLATKPIYAHGTLINLSVLKDAGAGDNALTAGFVVAGGSDKKVLIRAVGPGLIRHGVTQPMPDPQLRVRRQDQVVAENDDWAGAESLEHAFAAVGAFALARDGRDAAIHLALAPNDYTAQVIPASGAGGPVLVEVYDAARGAEARLINLSTLTRVGAGVDRLIAGFVIAGDAPKSVVIRAAGPSLVPFGLSANAVLADPQLTLFSGTTVVARNDDWEGDPLLEAAFRRAGAFPFSGGNSKDAALLLNLLPGSYTVHVEGAAGPAGAAIVEVYELR